MDDEEKRQQEVNYLNRVDDSYTKIVVVGRNLCIFYVFYVIDRRIYMLFSTILVPLFVFQKE